MSTFIHDTAIIDADVEIGEGTKIWAFSHISKGAKIGKNCVIGEGVHIGPNVIVGDNCKIQNHSLLYEGVEVGNKVFLGPNTITTNNIKPDLNIEYDWKSSDKFNRTLFKDGCAIGANSTIICGNVIGENAFVGAGSVVTKDIPDGASGFGNPFKIRDLNV